MENCWIVKSGCDFKEFSVLELEINDKTLVKSIKKVIVDSKIPEDQQTKQITQKYLSKKNSFYFISSILLYNF